MPFSPGFRRRMPRQGVGCPEEHEEGTRPRGAAQHVWTARRQFNGRHPNHPFANSGTSREVANARRSHTVVRREKNARARARDLPIPTGTKRNARSRVPSFPSHRAVRSRAPLVRRRLFTPRPCDRHHVAASRRGHASAARRCCGRSGRRPRKTPRHQANDEAARGDRVQHGGRLNRRQEARGRQSCVRRQGVRRDGCGFVVMPVLQ